MSQTQTETTQITPLDVLVSGIYKAQSRGAYNLNEAAILAKAVQHFGQRQMINPVIMKQIAGQGEQNLNIKEQTKEEIPPPPPPSPEATTLIPPPVSETTTPSQESKPHVSITDDDLSEVYVIGGNKNKPNKSNLRMVIEDDED